MILNFLKMYWLDIVTVIVGFLAVAFLLFLGKKDILKEMVLNLVREAEEGWESGTGIVKKAYVIDYFYNSLSPVFKLFVTKPLIEKWIDEGLYAIKDLIDDGLLNHSYEFVEYGYEEDNLE